jgi:hypothetical protein
MVRNRYQVFYSSPPLPHGGGNPDAREGDQLMYTSRAQESLIYSTHFLADSGVVKPCSPQNLRTLKEYSWA